MPATASHGKPVTTCTFFSALSAPMTFSLHSMHHATRSRNRGSPAWPFLRLRDDPPDDDQAGLLLLSLAPSPSSPSGRRLDGLLRPLVARPGVLAGPLPPLPGYTLNGVQPGQLLCLLLREIHQRRLQPLLADRREVVADRALTALELPRDLPLSRTLQVERRPPAGVAQAAGTGRSSRSWEEALLPP